MIKIDNLTLRRGSQSLFHQANLTIHAGDKVGLVGQNGCGKSSLLSALLGKLEPDQGSITLPKSIQISHVAQETPPLAQKAIDYVLDGDREFRTLEQTIDALTHASNTDADAISDALAHSLAQFEQISGYLAPSRAATLLHGLGFSPEAQQQPVNAFSGGWRMRLNLAQCLMCRSSLLLLDEPTNHLDIEAVVWLEQWLASYEGTLILISHDRAFLDRIVRKIVAIQAQSITAYNGNFTQFERYQASKAVEQQHAYEKQQREVKAMQAFITRFKAKASKAKQAQSRIKLLEKMVAVEAVVTDSPFQFLFESAQQPGHTLITANQLAISYQGEQLTLLQDLNFSVERQSRIGVLGKNGCGKSTLFKTLFNTYQAQRLQTDKTLQQAPPNKGSTASEPQICSGEINLATKVKIGYFAQHQLEQLHSELSPLEHLLQIDPGSQTQKGRDYLGGFGFRGDKADQAIKAFSGGERVRLVLALLVYQKPNLLLLDEPTNHLDLEMRAALTYALQQFEGAVLIISHDRYLLEHCCDQFWVIADQTLQPFDGDLADYAAWVQTRQQSSQPAVSSSSAPSPTSEDAPSSTNKKGRRQQAAEQRKRLEPLSRALKKVEKALQLAQEERATIQSELSDERLYQSDDKQALTALLKRDQQSQQQLETLEQEWLELSEQLEAAQNDAE